jgi:GAF domain-containing protein
LIPIGIVASLVSLVQRFRRSTGIERFQLRWLVTAAATVAVLYSIVLPIGLARGWSEIDTPGWVLVLETVTIASFALIPVAIGVSVLRYRLFEIDVVINRALLFAALAVFITGVYVAIVVGVGALVGSQASPVLSAAAAAVVALVFQPARRRAQRFADRLVYGKRATPYEVLSEFSDRLGFAYAADELLPRMARALADGTGAARGDVWVRIGDDLRSEATWPEGEERTSPIPVAANTEGSVTASSMLEPVRHQGELLRALSIKKRPGESITPTEEKLVRDLAAQARLVMRNARLIEELRTSRQRLVAAEDEERRLERNIHDGAQQQLVAAHGEGGARPKARRAGSEPLAGDPERAASGWERRVGEPSRSGPWRLPATARRPRDWPRHWYLRPTRPRCPSPWRPTASAGSHRTSKPPCTSARWRPSRMWRNTRMPPTRPFVWRTGSTG